MGGWEPREFTEYVYDGDRLVGSVTTREPEFTYADRVAMLGLQALRADTGPHGFLLSETTDPANQFAYEATNPIIDWAAKAEGDAQDAYYKKLPAEASRHGLLWGVKRRSVPAVEEVVVPAE